MQKKQTVFRLRFNFEGLKRDLDFKNPWEGSLMLNFYIQSF